MSRVITVHAQWDPEAKVWVAESRDLPLVTEADTVDALCAKLPGMVEDLLQDAGDTAQDLPIHLITQATTELRVRPRAA
jgi:hypothetical protein